jgi:hypothetical protein
VTTHIPHHAPKDPAGHIEFHIHCFCHHASFVWVFPLFADGGNCFACFDSANDNDTFTFTGAHFSDRMASYGATMLPDDSSAAAGAIGCGWSVSAFGLIALVSSFIFASSRSRSIRSVLVFGEQSETSVMYRFTTSFLSESRP